MENRNSDVKAGQSQGRSRTDYGQIDCSLIEQRIFDMPGLDEKKQYPVIAHISQCSNCRTFYAKNYYRYLKTRKKMYDPIISTDHIIRECHLRDNRNLMIDSIIKLTFLLIIAGIIVMFLPSFSSFPVVNSSVTQITPQLPSEVFGSLMAIAVNAGKTLVLILLASALLVPFLVSVPDFEKKGGMKICA